MKEHSVRTRLAFVLLAGLLALPIAETTSPVAAKQRTRTITRSFRNATAINLPVSATLPVSASLYPSPVAVRGLKRGKVRDVDVILHDFTHANAADVQVLLVGPDGQTAIVMAGVGEETAGNGAVTLRLDDEAAAPIPDLEIQSGAFQPINQDEVPIAFNAPAPNAGAGSALSVFDGGDPNGTWRLFVQDGFMADATGAVTGGWEIVIEAKVKTKRKRR